MKNQLGHSKDLVLYGSCGNVMYEYKNAGKIIVETFYNIDGGIIKQKTFIKDEGEYKRQNRDS
mgnify:CR=1 FL=1